MTQLLNMKYGIEEAITFQKGQNGLDMAVLRHASGSQAELYLYGGHITSWSSPAFGNLLYLSRRAAYGNGKSIRGGIPIIFPQFGSGALPSHGFARTSQWDVAASEVRSGGDVALTVSLDSGRESAAAIKKVWPAAFDLRVTVLLGEDTLALETSLENKGASPFDFQYALHTYFSVKDISRCAVRGLESLTYIDKVNNFTKTVEKRERVTVDQEYDRIYLAVPGAIELADDGNRRLFTIEREGLSDAVVWNPWADKCTNMNDMQPDDFKEMICVESGNIEPAIRLAAGSTFGCRQVISVKRT